MYNCHDCMLEFHDDNVALPTDERREMRDRRDANRNRLKSGLKRDGEPAPVGCHTQGSYAMRTMVQHAEKDYDIDDGVYFDKAALVGPQGGDKTPGAAKEMVRRAVHNEKFKTAPEVHTNCVRVLYDEGYHVDIPVYRRQKQADGTFSYELASTAWKSSDPLAVTKWFRKENGDRSPNLNNSGQLCRVTKLIKSFARSRESWRSQIATGFMISKLVVEQYVANGNREDRCLRDAMNSILNRLKGGLEIDHPVLNEKLTRDAEDSRVAFLRDKLEWALSELEILDKWDCTEAQARKAWDKVFSTTYFTDGTGAAKAAVTSAAILKSDSVAAASSAPVDRRGGGRYG